MLPSIKLKGAYQSMVTGGEITADPGQAGAIDLLAALADDLADYRPAAGRGGWMARLVGGRSRGSAPAGLYIHGGVGRGKSMLMDLFYSHLAGVPSRRVHFHAFMQEVHAKLHQWRAEGGGRQEMDPIPRLADQVAEECRILCFDELLVEDIADAMVLGRLFGALFERGVVVVATTNSAPDDLYKDGLQRKQFLPFIALIKDAMTVYHLTGETDYRAGRLIGRPVYHTPLGPKAEAALEDIFARLLNNATPAPDEIDVAGRTIEVSRAAYGVAYFTFDELCARPLGAGDYLAIAARFQTLLLSGVPVMNEATRNEAKRFTTLIDALYEGGVNLVCSAAAEPAALYPAGTGAEAFRRTASRLQEMRSDDYILAES